MPTNVTYIEKIVPTEPYRVDRRATIKSYLAPESVDIASGPNNSAVSGVRVNPDINNPDE